MAIKFQVKDRKLTATFASGTETMVTSTATSGQSQAELQRLATKLTEATRDIPA